MTALRLITVVACLAACHRAPSPSADPIALGRRYVEDAAYRRQVLESSLVNPENGYSTLRLARYREDVWGALPEWNPPVAPVRLADAAAKPEDFRPLDVDSVPWEHDALVALGREAFFRYPTQMQDALRVGLHHPERAGLWVSPDGLGGVVREKVAVGPPVLAMTCATCHASPGADGAPVAGRPNAALDLASMLGEAFPAAKEHPVWGAGRVDLTDDGVNNPVAISDLRAIRSEHYLHHDATVRNGLIELAIRIETLIITSNKLALRPPRKIAFALALYLWELHPTAVARPNEASARGEQLFSKQCAHCHAPPDYSGGRIALAKIGTDPSVGITADRTTGTYRIPSLRGVGDRSPLFAGGQVRDVDAVLDPLRTQKGHTFGLDLPVDARADLLAFLKTLQ